MASSPAGIYVRTLSCPSHPDLFSRRHKPNHVSINRRSRLDEKGTVMKLVIAGVGNNVSALTQGIELYREDVDGDLPGVSHPVIDGVHITDVDVVAAFDLAENKVGRPLSDAIFAAPNNYPNLGLKRPQADPEVMAGIRDADDGQSAKAVTKVLQAQGADVLLYSLPTGLPKIARAYGRAALAAGVAVVNCTPDPMANLPDLQAEAEEKGIPLVGDDLQSQFGSSIVHGTLLALLEERGLTLSGSYQVNMGGNADFANLHKHGEGKQASKHRALKQKVSKTNAVTVIPSAGFVPHLQDRKVAHMSIEARGWANTPVRLDVTLQVQDSSNAAGVIIDLIRIAAVARERGESGFPAAATALLKSPGTVTDPAEQNARARRLFSDLADEGA